MRTLVALLAFSATLAAAPLPKAEAETLSGRKVTLPEVYGGRPAVVVWSFSRDAGERVKDWMSPLTKDGLNAYSAAMLEAAPRFIRPMIRSGMKKDTPSNQLDRNLLLYKDEQAWRGALGLKNDKVPLIVLVDAAGGVVWSYSGGYDAKAMAELKQRLAALK